MQRSRLLITLLLAIIGALVIYILSIQSYSITEIDADNYESILHENNKSVWGTGIEDCIPFDDANCISIRTKTLFTEGIYKGVTLEKIQVNDHPSDYLYKFKNAPSGLDYSGYFSNDKIVSGIYIDGKLDTRKGPLIRWIIDNLLKKQGFTLKESKLIMGGDIIICESEDSFIIGTLNGKYYFNENNRGLVGLYFNAYSKRKYNLFFN
jgi:hypothetical protein